MATAGGKSIFGIETDDLQARLDARCLADVAAGRVIPHELIAEWLTKLAEGQKVPPPFDDP
jgi:predicted transcriptional regulator